MPLFFFDIHQGHEIFPDPGGDLFDSLDEAKLQAFLVVRELVREIPLAPYAHVIRVMLKDEQGQEVFGLEMSLSEVAPV